MDIGLGPIFAPLLPANLEILAPVWAISSALAHLICGLGLDLGILIFPFVFNIVFIASTTIMLPIED